MVLGVAWLRTLGPILWDFDDLTMTFFQSDHQVQRTGVGLWHTTSLLPRHLYSGATITGQESELAQLECLMEYYVDVFVPPTGLPPARLCDHRIHLKLGTDLVAVRPTTTHSTRRTSSSDNVRRCSVKVPFAPAPPPFLHGCCWSKRVTVPGASASTTGRSTLPRSRTNSLFPSSKSSWMNFMGLNSSPRLIYARVITKSACTRTMGPRWHSARTTTTLSFWSCHMVCLMLPWCSKHWWTLSSNYSFAAVFWCSLTTSSSTTRHGLSICSSSCMLSSLFCVHTSSTWRSPRLFHNVVRPIPQPCHLAGWRLHGHLQGGSYLVMAVAPVRPQSLRIPRPRWILLMLHQGVRHNCSSPD